MRVGESKANSRAPRICRCSGRVNACSDCIVSGIQKSILARARTKKPACRHTDNRERHTVHGHLRLSRLDRRQSGVASNHS